MSFNLIYNGFPIVRRGPYEPRYGQRYYILANEKATNDYLLTAPFDTVIEAMHYIDYSERCRNTKARIEEE